MEPIRKGTDTKKTVLPLKPICCNIQLKCPEISNTHTRKKKLQVIHINIPIKILIIHKTLTINACFHINRN